MWLNESYTDEGLNHQKMQATTLKYPSNLRKRKYELVNEPKKQPNRIFIDTKLAIKSIMDCRTISAHRFKTNLGLNQYDIIFTKEQSVLTNIISLFEGENMQAKYDNCGHRADLCFHDYKLAIETGTRL